MKKLAGLVVFQDHLHGTVVKQMEKLKGYQMEI